MYTEDDNAKYEDEYVEYNSVNNRTSLIIKIIIIVICILVLIWLIKSLNSNRYSNNSGKAHDENVLLIRLASEEYFFVKNKINEVKVVNLQTLKNEGLKQNIIDDNGKVCNDNNTKVLVNKENSNYKMTVILSCSTNDKEEVFYYNDKTLACNNCNGQTIMDGKNYVVADKKEDTKQEENNGGNNNVTDNISDDNNTSIEYSCISWTDWSKDRIYDSSLTERTKTMVLGVKRGNTISKKEYGNWSEYTKNPITPSDTLEVETKVEYNQSWSSPKTSNNIDVDNKNIKIISIDEEETDSISCPSSYISYNNKCYDYKEKVGNLSFKEFNSGDYKVNNGLCEGVKTLKNTDGKYVLTYINCRYHEIAKDISSVERISTGEVTYTYQELITTSTTYYRSRTVTTINESEDDIYTEKKYEESELPIGYEKVDGSEEVYYSYKLTVCEK